jgi:hypothetical protein
LKFPNPRIKTQIAVNNTYNIEVNTPQPNFLGSLYEATIATIPENNEATIESIPPALDSSHKNPATSPQTNAAISVYQNQFFIPTILYIIYTL